MTMFHVAAVRWPADNGTDEKYIHTVASLTSRDSAINLADHYAAEHRLPDPEITYLGRNPRWGQ